MVIPAGKAASQGAIHDPIHMDSITPERSLPLPEGGGWGGKPPENGGILRFLRGSEIKLQKGVDRIRKRS
ncbi:hypothetical protein [Erythrobacter donghaensis]|jgi:hypothetical protein|uniref:hypothetical protein n=1 Tax=Erythrobacter donghaensis TaxID=267135 RepID=UPI000A86AF98|nr:hypothetical protein [Erythrobacter donghaensis]